MSSSTYKGGRGFGIGPVAWRPPGIECVRIVPSCVTTDAYGPLGTRASVTMLGWNDCHGGRLEPSLFGQ